MRQSTRETKKTKARDEDAESDYKHLTLRMRKRMFTSLHGVGNFNKMNKDGLNFLFNQIKGDYIEFEILRRPKLTIEDAAFMAALALQVKRYKKILTSKDNALKPEEIRKSLDYCVPYSIQKDKKLMTSWDQKIHQCFEAENIKDLTIEEAQAKFLTQYSSYPFTFGSYYTVRRKPPMGLINNFSKKNKDHGLNPVALTGSNITNRRQTPSDLTKKMKLRIRARQSSLKANKNKNQSKFAHSDSSNEMSSSSSSDSDNNEVDDSGEPTSNDVSMTENDESKMSSSMLDQSQAQSDITEIDEQNIGLLDDIFPGVQTELLLVVAYDTINIVENSKRDISILEIKHEDLLYVMGKDDILKISFGMKQSNVKEKFVNNKLRRQQTNENYQQDIIDVKTVFICPNARVIAEDIMAYIQINLVEKTKGKDYMDVQKPQFVDFLTQDDFLGNRSLNDSRVQIENFGEENQSKGQNIINVTVNDDLLMGLTSFKRTQAKDLKEKGTKTILNEQHLSRQFSTMSIDPSNRDEEDSDE